MLMIRHRALFVAVLLSQSVQHQHLTFAQETDAFGIVQIYPSNPDRVKGDWTSAWERSDSATLTKSYEADPRDEMAVMRGARSIAIPGDGTCEFQGLAPRLYIESQYDWDNVEFTVYGKYVTVGTPQAFSGLTLAARNNHGDYDDGCSAPGYYARMYLDSGKVAFQKEYYHDETSIIYTSPNEVSFFDDDAEGGGGLPLDRWIGLKFVVYTLAGDDDDDDDDQQREVKLELYIDLEEGVNGGNWQLAHETVDAPGVWFKSPETNTIPDRCDTQDGDTVMGSRKYCFLRSDGSNETLVVWRQASVRSIAPPGSVSGAATITYAPYTPHPCEEVGGLVDDDVCCASMCGDCGGAGCADRPGGARFCCSEVIRTTAPNRTCDVYDAPCILAVTPQCSSGLVGLKSTCCHDSCGGACGGPECSQLPGGAEGCCEEPILEAGRSCADYEPPCVVVVQDTLVPDEALVVGSVFSGTMSNTNGERAFCLAIVSLLLLLSVVISY
jgi:hypothetical protein